MTYQKAYRSQDDKILAGVCGGLGEYFDVDPTILRLAWAAITIFSGIVPGVLIYIIALVIIPKKPNGHERALQASVIEVGGHDDEKRV